MTRQFQECIEEYNRNKHHLYAWSESIRMFFVQHPGISSGPDAIVHSIRSRLKDDEHLRKKLERKSAQGDLIEPQHLLTRITDLAGVRVLHLYQAQFKSIHAVIEDQIARGDWCLDEPAVAYTWDPESKQFFDGIGIRTELKESHYTSIHYVLKPRSDSELSCELQVRTLFEEAWGEIDHQINYPEPTAVNSCKEQLRVLAKLVGASTRLADSILRTHEESGMLLGAELPAAESDRAHHASATLPFG